MIKAQTAHKKACTSDNGEKTNVLHCVKILFDMDQLSLFGTKGTGIVRVADTLFKNLLKHPQIDVYPLITTQEGNVYDYLQFAGLTHLASKLVFMPGLRKTFRKDKKDNLYKRLLYRFLTLFYKFKYHPKIKNFDAYFSPFSPISPIIYQSKLKTYAVLYDLIPLIHPEFGDPKFAKKYTAWINDLKADKIFAISKSTKSDFLNFRPDYKAEKIDVVYLGADNKFFPLKHPEKIAAMKQKYGITSNKYFLALSEMSKRKNFEHLLAAFQCFLEQTNAQDISLVLAGPIRGDYVKQAEEAKLRQTAINHVVHIGFVDDTDLAALYSGAEAFVYPSLYEGFGLPVLEAMQCGAPVVCANNSSLPEVGAKCVCYICGHDENETAAALTKIYEDQEFKTQLAKKSCQRAKHFNWTSFINHICTTLLEEHNASND